jgi:mRNA-degrading endonuclease toxin of MazEF toxin-antitoxin module
MASAVVSIPMPDLREVFGQLLRLVALPTRAAESDRVGEIPARVNELVRTVATVIDDLVSATLEKRTSADFRAARLEVFPQYFAAMRALGDLSRIVLPKQTLVRLSAEWFCELEADLREKGPSAFGADLTERGLFTAWTLRKIHDMAQEITVSLPEAKDTGKDREIAMDFASRAIWARFHVDCLTKAMRDKNSIYPEVAEDIRDGLRQAVDTYACIREWADLRNPRPEPEVNPIDWTTDDELLLFDSMRDLERESA